jgi:hypothetical protein
LESSKVSSTFPYDNSSSDSSPEVESIDSREAAAATHYIQSQPRRTFLERVHEMRVAKRADARSSPNAEVVTPVMNPLNSSSSSTKFFTPSPGHNNNYSLQIPTTTKTTTTTTSQNSSLAGLMSSRAFSLVKERRKAAANTRTPPLPYSSASSITIATQSSDSQNLKHQHRSSPMLHITHPKAQQQQQRQIQDLPKEHR